jgi:cysteine synthase B
MVPEPSVAQVDPQGRRADEGADGDAPTHVDRLLPASGFGPCDPPLGPLLSRVGDTPLVPLRRIAAGLLRPGVELWAKLEGFNPGGSVKDRAALNMILEAERAGRLRPGMTILDSSSGNTGIAYGLVAAVRGYRVRLCLPANANRERKALLGALGVEVIETDPLEGSDGAIREARRLAAGDPNAVYLDQYSNPANWGAHVRTTGPELWAALGGRLTHFVAGLGTSGTFTGTSRYLRSVCPGVRCVAVQPDGPFHGLEGLKHMESSIPPAFWDPGSADALLFAPTEESLALLGRLGREEGVLVGPSAGAALWGAIEVARGLDHGVVVTIFPDGADRYLSDAHLWGRTGR